MIKTFTNGANITKADWEAIDNYIEKLDISLQEAIELREFDKFETDKKTDFEKEQKEIQKTKNKKDTITSEENLALVFDVIKVAFVDKPFKSKDLYLLVADKFTNRQTPHALKKLAEDGKIKYIEGTSPKQYSLV